MGSWCVTQPGEALEELELPVEPIGDHGVRLAVSHCGVCHSDVHFWEGELDFGGPTKVKIADMGLKLPLTLGHEIVGQVIEKGAAVDDVEIGETRLVYPWIGCGECSACLAGEDNYCSASQALGVRRPGGFGASVVVPHSRYLLPLDGIDPALAATYACSGLTSYSAISKLRTVAPEDPIVLIGSGGLGLSSIAILKALGHQNIVVTDVNEEKCAVARQAGARAAIVSRNPDAADELKSAAGGPIRSIIDYVNNPQTFGLGLSLMAPGARMILVGMFGGSFSLPLMAMPSRKLMIQGSFVGSLGELKGLLALAKGGKLAPIPINLAPRPEVTDALRALQAGSSIGRTVLVS